MPRPRRYKLQGIATAARQPLGRQVSNKMRTGLASGTVSVNTRLTTLTASPACSRRASARRVSYDRFEFLHNARDVTDDNPLLPGDAPVVMDAPPVDMMPDTLPPERASTTWTTRATCPR